LRGLPEGGHPIRKKSHHFGDPANRSIEIIAPGLQIILFLKRLSRRLEDIFHEIAVPQRSSPTVHQHRNRHRAPPQQEMGMIVHKAPREATRVRFRNQFRQPSDKVRPVIIGSKYLPTLDPPDDHMMQRPRRVYSRFSWHFVKMGSHLKYLVFSS
jgi:hypothetical protein